MGSLLTLDIELFGNSDILLPDLDNSRIFHPPIGANAITPLSRVT
jgi:hypothetical protein